MDKLIGRATSRALGTCADAASHAHAQAIAMEDIEMKNFPHILPSSPSLNELKRTIKPSVPIKRMLKSADCFAMHKEKDERVIKSPNR